MEADGKNSRQFWLGMVISLASLAAIFFFIQPAQVLDALEAARFDYLGLSLAGILAFMVFRAMRWRYMLGNEVSWRVVFHIQNIGYMLTNLLPFRVGDVARAVLIGNVPPISLARGLSTMVVERLLDMLFIVTLLPFTLAEVEKLPAVMRTGARVSGGVALVGIVVLIMAANKRPFALRLARQLLRLLPFLNPDAWLRRIDDLLLGLHSLTRFRDGAMLIFLSILTWLPIIFAYYTGLRAVNLQPTWAMAGFVVCAAALSIAAPSSPGQIGVFHAGVFAALQLLGQPEANSLGFAFLYHALNLTTMVILGIIGLMGTGTTWQQVVASTRKYRQKQETPTNP